MNDDEYKQIYKYKTLNTNSEHSCLKKHRENTEERFAEIKRA